MIEIILIIIICVTIYKRTQRAKGGDSVKGNHSLPNTTVSTSNPPKGGNGSENLYGQGSAGQRGGSGMSSVHGAARPAAQKQTARAAIQEAKEDGHSTTAYLMEKAEADAREHEREKYEEQKRLNETRGGLAVAERYLDGDRIPNGKRCVACGYCGAENLVPMVPRTRYSCYFCREPLN